MTDITTGDQTCRPMLLFQPGKTKIFAKFQVHIGNFRILSSMTLLFIFFSKALFHVADLLQWMALWSLGTLCRLNFQPFGEQDFGSRAGIKQSKCIMPVLQYQTDGIELWALSKADVSVRQPHTADLNWIGKLEGGRKGWEGCPHKAERRRMEWHQR